MDRLMKCMFSFFTKISAYPFQLDFESHRLGGLLIQKKSTSNQFILWRFNQLFTLVILVHEIISLYSEFDNYLTTKSYELLVLHVLWLLVTIACNFCFHLTIYLNHDKYPSLQSQTLKLADFVLKKAKYRSNEAERIFLRCKAKQLLAFASLAWFIFQTFCFSSAVVAYFHQGPWFIWSLILRNRFWNYDEPFWLVIVEIIFEELAEFIQWGALTLNLYVIVVNLQTTCAVLKIIGSEFLHAKTSDDFYNLHIAYNASHLLNYRFNSLFQFSFVPSFLLTFQIIIIGCLLVFFKTFHYGYVHITGFAFFLHGAMLGTLLLVVQALSLVHTNSSLMKPLAIQKYASMQLGAKKRRELRFKSRVLREYGAQVASYFVIAKSYPLVVLDMLANTTATVLLSVEF